MIDCKCRCKHCHPENFGNDFGTVNLKEGEKIETMGYTLFIDKFDYQRWKNAIEQGELQGAEAILGLLLGRAKSVQVISKKEK